MARRRPNVDLVGFTEIAERTGSKRNTVEQWKQREIEFPLPDWTVSGRPIWWGPTIEAWCKKTGREYKAPK